MEKNPVFGSSVLACSTTSTAWPQPPIVTDSTPQGTLRQISLIVSHLTLSRSKRGVRESSHRRALVEPYDNGASVCKMANLKFGQLHDIVIESITLQTSCRIERHKASS